VLAAHPPYDLYASIAATLNFIVRSPRMFAEILGKLLFWCGEDKIVYGSEAPICQPQWALRAFRDVSIVACQRDGTTASPRPRDHLGVDVMVIGSPRRVNQDTPVAAGWRVWPGRWRRRWDSPSMMSS
jgi:hypothetical protein